MMTTKPALTLTEQAKLLLSRGLLVDDISSLETYLFDTNYYRFSGYARQFQIDPGSKNNNFIAGTTLADIQRVCAWDAQLW